MDHSPSLPISQERWDQLTEIASQFPLQTFPCLRYPNKHAERILQQFPQQRLLIFGYGSLLNRESAARSVSIEALDSMQPALAFGLQRLFDRNVPNARYVVLHPKDVAMLNVHTTERPQDMINGILMEVGAEDLKELIKREVGYDLIPIPCMLWREALETKSVPLCSVAYTFSASREKRGKNFYTATDIFPLHGYAHIVKEGAVSWGAPFLEFWMQSTYLADGKTLYPTWEATQSAHAD